MNAGLAYVLGAATPFVAVVVAGIVMVAIERKTGWGPCEMCEAAGIPVTSWDIGERRNITAWPIRQWHRQVTSRRPRHRRAWQAWHEQRHAARMPSLTAQRRYGTAR